MSKLDTNLLPPMGQRALQILTKSALFIESHLETLLLWKHETTSLHYNRNLAIKCFP